MLLGLVWLAVEVAEATSRYADIRSVDVAVNLPSYNIFVGHHFGAQTVGVGGKFVQWCVVPQLQRLLAREFFVRQSFVVYLLQIHTAKIKEKTLNSQLFHYLCKKNIKQRTI